MIKKTFSGSILINTLLVFALVFTLVFLAFNKFYKVKLENLDYKQNANVYYAAKDGVIIFNDMLNDHFNNIDKQVFIEIIKSINTNKIEEEVCSKFNDFIIRNNIYKFTPQNKFEYILNINNEIINVCVEYKYNTNNSLDTKAAKKIRFISTATNEKNNVSYNLFGCINFNLENVYYELYSNNTKINRFDFISDEYFLIEYILQLENNKPDEW